MKYIGKCNVQYANNLCGTYNLVLRADRQRLDEPVAEFYTIENTKELLINISNDLSCEVLKSNSQEGNKSRTDIYFLCSELDNIINILEPLVNSLDVEFDITSRTTPNPTGLEHPGGILLGEIFNAYSTNIKAKCEVCYAKENKKICINSRMYVEPENKNGKKLHLGISMNSNQFVSTDKINTIKLFIPFTELKRFLQCIRNSKKFLEERE